MNRNRYGLIVALGGGGDIIAAFLLGESLQRRGIRPVLASLAWERFVKDPLPGPRQPSELNGIEMINRSLGKSSGDCCFPSGARTNQGALSAHFGIEENYILDAWGGVRSLLNGLTTLNDLFSFEEVWGIDVGGDVLAGTPYPTLSSPLGDALTLAALAAFNQASRVAVVAPGLDGEIPSAACRQMVRSHCKSGLIGGWSIFDNHAVNSVAMLFDQRKLDSEVTAAVVRSYQGLSGKLLMRRASIIVRLGLECIPFAIYRAGDLVSSINTLSSQLLSTESLDEASDVLESLGYQSELKHERAKLQTNQKGYVALESTYIAPLLKEEIENTMAESKVDLIAERYFADHLKVNIKSIQSAVDTLQAAGAIEVVRPFITLKG